MRGINSPKADDPLPITARQTHLLDMLGHVAFPEDNSSSQQPPPADQDLIPGLSNLSIRGEKLEKNEQAQSLKLSLSGA